MDRLGLGPEVCLARNPRLVYGRMTGWGQDGPLAPTAGHDIDYIAVSGALGAMAREGDLPRGLAAVHPLYRVPRRAELVLGAVVVLIVLTVDLRGAIGFSSFGVLLYYFVANLAALRQARAFRRYPRAVSVLGALGCAVLVVTLPLPAVVTGALVVVAGFVLRELRSRGARLGSQ
jgi:APA family basic amino acid/polyamine antiporter